ncbi:MAG: PIN domain-containing protein [Actinobacteria bacterium]|nr:PIN domain-containing protein [Actinomycetota bacterium]
MEKPKIYLDTSVINGLFAYDAPYMVEATVELFERFAQEEYEAYISNLVLAEIEETKDSVKRDKLTRFIVSLEELGIIELRVSEECEELADEYIKKRIIPGRVKADAIHIAIAVVNGLDLIVSWDFNHIVNWKTKVKVNKVNKEQGYPEIDIISPEEV